MVNAKHFFFFSFLFSLQSMAMEKAEDNANNADKRRLSSPLHCKLTCCRLVLPNGGKRSKTDARRERERERERVGPAVAINAEKRTRQHWERERATESKEQNQIFGNFRKAWIQVEPTKPSRSADVACKRGLFPGGPNNFGVFKYRFNDLILAAEIFILWF